MVMKKTYWTLTHWLRLRMHDGGNIRETVNLMRIRHVILIWLHVRSLHYLGRLGNCDLVPPLIQIMIFLFHLLHTFNLLVCGLAADVVAFGAIVTTDFVFSEIGPASKQYLLWLLLRIQGHIKERQYWHTLQCCDWEISIWGFYSYY